MMESSVHKCYPPPPHQGLAGQPGRPGEKGDLGDPGESGRNVRHTFMNHHTDSLSIFFCATRLRRSSADGQPFSIFIDLCLITGQSRTCRAERRKRRSGLLFALFLQGAFITLYLLLVDSLFSLYSLLQGTSRASRTTRKSGECVFFIGTLT